MPEALPSSTATGPAPRRLEAGRGVDWWREAWGLFMKAPWMWLLFALIILVVDAVLGIIPLIGTVAGALVLPGFLASWMVAARKLESGGRLAAGDVFVAFQLKPKPMLILGALFVVTTLLILAFTVGGAGIGLTAGSTGSGSDGLRLSGLIGLGGLSALLALLLSFVVGTMLWFSTALVMFHDMEPVPALKASWTASFKNVAPFLVYGLIFIGAAVVASILFGLGWIVLLPVSFLTAYTSYKDVFGA